VLFIIIVGETLSHPIRHTLFLIAMMVTIVAGGAAIGAMIRHFLPGSGVMHFLVECMLWLVAAALLASPLAKKTLRDKLAKAIPR
jgi:cadmium resistance protein CadD (predicted permease)